MKTVCSFLTKFSSIISWVLSCFDRVIFKGHLPISQPAFFEKFVDGKLGMRRADFLKFVAPQWSQSRHDGIDHAEAFAKKYRRLYEYSPGKIDPGTTVNGTPTGVYAYDASGNLDNTGNTIGAGNEITYDGTWYYTYDASGNVTEMSQGTYAETWVYTYNLNNQVVSATEYSIATISPTYLVQTINYSYDVFGNMVSRTVTPSGGGSTTTGYAYDLVNGQMYAELSSGGTIDERYLYANGAIQARTGSDTDGDAWLLTDYMGSVTEILNAGGTMVEDTLNYVSPSTVALSLLPGGFNMTQSSSAWTGDAATTTPLTYEGMMFDTALGFNIANGVLMLPDGGMSGQVSYASTQPNILALPYFPGQAAPPVINTLPYFPGQAAPPIIQTLPYYPAQPALPDIINLPNAPINNGPASSGFGPNVNNVSLLGNAEPVTQAAPAPQLFVASPLPGSNVPSPFHGLGYIQLLQDFRKSLLDEVDNLDKELKTIPDTLENKPKRNMKIEKQKQLLDAEKALGTLVRKELKKLLPELPSLPPGIEE